jgi:enoyl-CoA hydratase/carnithine racemase
MRTASPPDQTVYLDRQGDIVRLVLNRPEKRNAVTQAMWEAIPELLAEAAADPAIKLLVLGSSTPAAFSAGADIGEFEAIGKDPARRAANQAAIRASMRGLAEFAKPTIAEIAGPCVGGGCGLALACDLRVAADTAILGITPAKLGLVYSLHDTKQLVDLVGPAHAKSILFTGRLVKAEEALRIGLVNAVHPLADLPGAVAELAQSICTASQHSVRQTKQIIRMILNGVADDTPDTSRWFDDAFDGPDHQEGASAFLAKRSPGFPVR